MDRRKLNEVFTKPCTFGFMTIVGIIGSGKTKEEVVLMNRAPINGTDYIEWKHHIGEQWSKIQKLTSAELVHD